MRCEVKQVNPDGEYAWFWSVISPNVLKYGFTYTKDQAIRDSRNFIRRNQNWIYS